MGIIEDYVAGTEGTCGKEKDIIVVFRQAKKDEAIKKILEKSELRESHYRIRFDLTFKGFSFHLYSSGKAIFRSLKDKEELNSILSELLS